MLGFYLLLTMKQQENSKTERQQRYKQTIQNFHMKYMNMKYQQGCREYIFFC